ncbi:endonuclease [Podophage Lau218]|uniref:Putative phage protein n=2 Tax=Lauvirus lau218 TaxID=1465639 RepID=A0A060BGU2_9CAUD|nr:endonuclease [Podophage Lau218]AIA83130.1 putative phage protein [Podophage Lau218]AIA83177.1 putative phage protein [Lauvirus lau218]AIA83226.1 putative phage protein [Lauvirus lau218]
MNKNTKKCYACNTTKDIKDFWKNQTQCISCKNEGQEKYRATDDAKKIRNKRASAQNVGFYRQKQLTRMKTFQKIKSGKLIRTKCKCGDFGVEFHHHSYDLDDSWKDGEFVCLPCHTQIHKAVCNG